MFYLSEMSYLWAIYGLFMGGTCQKKAVILHRNLKVSNFMNGLSIIGTAAAWLNYRKAKAEYEALQAYDNTVGILAAIEQYNAIKYNQLDKYDKDEYGLEENSDKFVLTPLLNCGMMAGKKCRIEGWATLINKTDVDYEIQELEVGISVFGEPTLYTKYGNKFTLKAGHSENILLPPSTNLPPESPLWSDFLSNAIIRSFSDVMVMNDGLLKAKEAVCEANGKSLITSCKSNTCLVGGDPSIVTATAFLKYYDPKSDTGSYAEYKNIEGAFCYKGEAFYPHRNW